MMEQHLQAVAERYEEVGFLLSRPEVVADQNRFRQLSVEYARLDEIVSLHRAYLANRDHIQQAQAMLEDPELRELAAEELAGLKQQGEQLTHQLQVAMLPQDPNDQRNALLEIRAGTGGEEAALFAADLLRMYQRYAERQGWQLSISSLNDTDIGGVKEAVCLVSGQAVYAQLKYESGVHRVQRVPQTESGGRIHTSAATVVVLPEDEQIELTIDPNDLRIDTYRSSGAGGQHVNRTDSAVRITHLPTGIVATCQDEKSQIKNREKAMRVLKSRLLDQLQSQQTSRQVDARRSQIGSGDRSQRIRTYNFPQSRVTDHRINLTLYNLEEILQGECERMIQPLIQADVAARLEELNG